MDYKLVKESKEHRLTETTSIGGQYERGKLTRTKCIIQESTNDNNTYKQVIESVIY